MRQRAGNDDGAHVGATVGEVDLCERHAKALDTAVKPYVTVARTGKATAAPATANATAKKAPAKKATAKKAGASRSRRGRNGNIAVTRNWGRANGFDVATRGRHEPELTTAYNAAHSTNGTTAETAPATDQRTRVAKAAKAPVKKTAKSAAKKSAVAKPAKAPAKKTRTRLDL